MVLIVKPTNPWFCFTPSLSRTPYFLQMTDRYAFHNQNNALSHIHKTYQLGDVSHTHTLGPVLALPHQHEVVLKHIIRITVHQISSHHMYRSSVICTHTITLITLRSLPTFTTPATSNLSETQHDTFKMYMVHHKKNTHNQKERPPRPV